jgi:hypothetical protein
MWMLQFLPDSVILWFTNILLTVGVVLTLAGFFVHRIPLLWKYQLPFKIFGVILLATGVYFRGGYSIEMIWREKVAELEKQVEEARQRSEKVNTVIKDRVVYRDRVVTQQAETLVQYVDREVVKTIPAQCDILPNEIIEVHNKAARLNEVIQELDKK